MLKFWAKLKENLEVNGNIELLSEVSHLWNELRKLLLHIVLLPSRVLSFEEVSPWEAWVQNRVPVTIESSYDGEFVRGRQEAQYDSDFEYFDFRKIRS